MKTKLKNLNKFFRAFLRSRNPNGETGGKNTCHRTKQHRLAEEQNYAFKRAEMHFFRSTQFLGVAVFAATHILEAA